MQAASYGFDKLTKQQIGEFIREACRYGRARPHEIHRKIVSLGPRFFITTNYDDLIEQSLREWQPNRFYRPPVTNRQLTEAAEIVHARAIDFIFKPHGDAADSESIILTREQYGRLLPQGENQSALESVKLLLASRPVLYLGFGLRDPDFIYVRDLLANTYKGGVRDHYAIMADVQEQEVDHWRRNYGIHLVGYNTLERADRSRDHSPLLSCSRDSGRNHRRPSSPEGATGICEECVSFEGEC
ncbi:SIR2 family protein [Pseudomonas monsensis]|uniref:SIR2 family NAD-dependent protein deacylase n=1 Tax=Pseudomonas monsensis TaxID=2745509 RepID=UPI00192DFC87|nr:SIR2 family protein [Pseudomonas monsensis]QXI01310.1 SIR2 family protein [Pseudomonas monsensis]